MSALTSPILYAGAIRIDVDLTSLIVLVLFTALFFTLKKLVFAPFLEDVDQRDQRTTQMQEATRELEARAEELKSQHKEALDGATEAAFQARRELRVKGLKERDDQVGKAQAQAQAEYQAGSEKLQAQFESARQEALAQADSLAESIASKVLGRALVWIVGALSLQSLWGVSLAHAGDTTHQSFTPEEQALYFFDLANQGATLLILVMVITYFGGKKLTAVLKERAATLSQEISAAQTAHDQAQKALDRYEEMIAQLETEREEMIKSYRAQGEAEKARLIEEAEREVERISTDTQRMLSNELAHMQRKIEQELVELSLTRAEALVHSKLNIDDHHRLTDEYLSQLENS